MSERLNIKNMMVEGEPKKSSAPEAPFDPYYEITPQDWSQIEETVETLIKDGKYAEVAEVVGNIAIVGKEHIPADLPIKKIKQAIHQNFVDHYEEGAIQMVAAMRVSGVDIALSPQQEQQVQKKLDDTKERFAHKRVLMTMAADMKVSGLSPSLDDVEQFHKEKEIKSFKDLDDEHMRYLASARILGKNFHISEEVWKSAKTVFEQLRSMKEYEWVLGWAASLTILAADEVRVPRGGGLVINQTVMDQSENLPPTPQSRNF